MRGLLEGILTVCVLTLLIMQTSHAQVWSREPVRVEQWRGADQSLHYASLTKYGPWDDRNYSLTKDDLTFLAPNEHELFAQIPAFFRVELRKEWPHLQSQGPAQYPRAALQLFRIRYGGLMQDGKIQSENADASRNSAPLNSEIQLNQLLGRNEVTVEINPANPLQVIAGANGGGGQEMYYSTDGGANWAVQGVLPDTCCDPTVDWTADGSVAFTASLSGNIGVSAWRSVDAGQTWVDRVDLTASGSDKEFLHVDKSLSSPYQDNVYITYHDGNVMQFAKSTDSGGSYSIQSFPGAPFGIGSDITTDPAGNVYYFYAATGARQIIMLKSVDGGGTFASPQPIASTNGAFDFPIPSMETRRAWIYASADADQSGGTFDGSVYVAWADTVDPENNSVAEANHVRVWVAYSRDGGATWSYATPHSTSDMQEVDRWNPWITVDENGVVHVVFYDTRHSENRSGVDLYHAFSGDGGVTWNNPERVSTQTSANLTDGQEFGDYNGLSVVGGTVMPVWTDNREGPPNSRDVFAADVQNSATTPGFTLNVHPLEHSVCAPGNLAEIDISVGSVLGFASPVVLGFDSPPPGLTGSFESNPLALGSSTTAQVSVSESIASGEYSFAIKGSASGAAQRFSTIQLVVSDAVPAVSTPLTPADGETVASLAPMLSWAMVDDAISYIVEIDDDPAFASIEAVVTTSSTSAAIELELAPETTYYWRVRAVNLCGESLDSQVSSFTTGLVFCKSDFGAIPDDSSTSDTMTVARFGEIQDLDVEIVVAHTFVGDLAFTLVNEYSGKSSSMIDRPGHPALGLFGCGQNNINVVLDDEGTSPVEDACSSTDPAVGGRLTPNTALSVMDGEELSGTWRLDISDNAGLDVGSLNKWCLVPTVGPSPDTDGDGLPDSRDNCKHVSNIQQLDFDENGIGDKCETALEPLTFPAASRVAGGDQVAVFKWIGSLQDYRGTVKSAVSATPGASTSFLSSGRQPVDTGIADISGSSSLAVLGVDGNGRAWVEVKDAASGNLIHDVWYPPGYTPISLAVVPDLNNNGASELAVLLTRDSDGRGWVHIKDAATGDLIRYIWLRTGYTPVDLEILPDLDGNSGDEVAVLMTRDSDGRAWVEVKDAKTGALIKYVWFRKDHTPLDLEIVPDQDGNPGAELAVLMSRDSDSRTWVEVKDTLTNALVRYVWFKKDHTPVDLEIVPNFNGNPGSELAVLMTRDSDDRTWVQTKDSANGDVVSYIWFQPDFSPRDLEIMDNLDGNPAHDLAVLGEKGDGRVQVEFKDPQSGAFINRIGFP